VGAGGEATLPPLTTNYQEYDRMDIPPSVKTVRQLGLPGLFLICLAVLLGGCQVSKPPLGPEAQALKTQLLGDLDKLTSQLVEPAAREDWPAVELLLQTAYENMQKEAKLVPKMIVVLDRNSITRVRFPSSDVGQFDFSNYAQAKTTFNKKRKDQAIFYLKGTKIYIVLAPLLQKNNVIGAVALSFLAAALEKQWHVSEKEFLSIDLNK
jgi:hypothetical protein